MFCLNIISIFFYDLLTVHPCTILLIKPTWCTIFLSIFYLFSLHVSGDYMPIIRRNNCIYATVGTCYSVWMSGMQGGMKLHSTLHTRQSSIQNNKYQVSHKYSCFSWWWAHSSPKHVEKRNKHTKKNCSPSWLYLQDY